MTKSEILLIATKPTDIHTAYYLFGALLQYLHTHEQ